MIIAAAFQFHDDEIELFLIDSAKLDAENPLESMILDEIQSGIPKMNVNFEAMDVEGDFHLTSCRHEDFPVEIHGQIFVNVIFDC